MKLTIISIKFKRFFTFNDIFSIIYGFGQNVSDTIKLVRRYRHYIVGIQYDTKNTYIVSFHFPTRDILMSFRKEYAIIEKELLK